MKMLYGSLIGIVAVLMVVPLAAAGDQAFPSWDKQINPPGRFKVLSQFAGAAVLDNETGLVWQQSPETAPNPTITENWLNAQSSCNIRNVGGRKGWRLPTLQELASLIDPAIEPPGPTLPPGHPFSNVQPSVYWSATTLASDSSAAWVVSLDRGVVRNGDKSKMSHVWCVRGGQGVNPQ